jgi:hypothetical protein
MDHARELASFAVESLFSESDPFCGRVDRVKLRTLLERATLKKLVTEDDDVLTEEEFNDCIKEATSLEC